MNRMGYTLFTNVKVALNNVVIDSGSVLYPYRGDFKMRLLNSKDVKERSLQLMGFDKEVGVFISCFRVLPCRLDTVHFGLLHHLDCPEYGRSSEYHRTPLGE